MEEVSRLDELEQLLREGNRRSGQRAYGRRAPASAAIPFLSRARTGLRAYTRQRPEDARGWRLLSFAEEMFLAYPPALAAFERALELAGKKDKSDLKRLGRLRGAVREWAALGLTPQQLAELGDYLKEGGGTDDSADDFADTKAWLAEHAFSQQQAERTVEAFRARGAVCDAQVIDIVVGDL